MDTKVGHCFSVALVFLAQQVIEEMVFTQLAAVVVALVGVVLKVLQQVHQIAELRFWERPRPVSATAPLQCLYA